MISFALLVFSISFSSLLLLLNNVFTQTCIEKRVCALLTVSTQVLALVWLNGIPSEALNFIVNILFFLSGTISTIIGSISSLQKPLALLQSSVTLMLALATVLASLLYKIVPESGVDIGNSFAIAFASWIVFWDYCFAIRNGMGLKLSIWMIVDLVAVVSFAFASFSDTLYRAELVGVAITFGLMHVDLNLRVKQEIVYSNIKEIV